MDIKHEYNLLEIWDTKALFILYSLQVIHIMHLGVVS